MSKRELEKKLEDQHKQILLYEKKLKDVVRAYKSLETEKNALQTVVESFESKEGGEETTSSEEKTGGEEKTINGLKEALATLTKEKLKREVALTNDKKTLLAENETLKEKLKKTADETESQADKMEKIIKELSQKIKRIEAHRERELTDHGSVLAEMQQRYAKEKLSAENAHKQLAELYKKLHEKEGLPVQFQTKEKDLQNEIAQLRKDVKEWKLKAERTPTVQLLQDELANMKAAHQIELEEAQSKSQHTSTSDLQSVKRISQLEETTQRLTERVAVSEREKFLVDSQLSEALEQVKQLKEELEKFRISEASQPSSEDEVSQLQSICRSLKEKRINVHDLIDTDPRLAECMKKCDKLEDEYEKYKLKAEAVLRAKATAPTESSEDAGLRALVGQLHDKLRNLEVSHSADQARYEQTTRMMRERITELERSEEMCRSEMRREMQHNISEMEAEMQKQRSRTLDVLAEKERELEITKSILVSMRSEQLGAAPADPPQAAKLPSNRRKSDVKKYADRRISSGSRRSVESTNSVEFVGTPSDMHSFSFPNVNESRNMFYEDELAKKDKELQEMRNSVQSLDYRMREMEQSSLCKDLQGIEMTEKLKEEIRILEGKLALVSGGGEMEYLRNVFVQYLACPNTSAGKNILKAIGMVLKLSPNEMKAIDKK